MGNLPSELSLGAFPANPPLLSSMCMVEKGVQTEGSQVEGMRRYPSPGRKLAPGAEDEFEMVMPAEQFGDLDSKVTHSDAVSRSLGPALDWSLLDSAEAKIVEEQKEGKVRTTHIREKSDTVLMHPPCSPTFSKASSKSAHKPSLLWVRSQAKLTKITTPVIVKSEAKVTTVHLKKNVRNSPSLKIMGRAGDEGGATQVTKSSQSPSGSLARMKELRSSCSTLPLPRRITISLAEQETGRNSTAISTTQKFSPQTPGTLELKGKLGATKSEVEMPYKRTSDLPEDLPVWPHSRGASPVMLEHLELVEKESIRRQFGKSAAGKETGLFYALSKSPKGSFLRSPRSQTRFKPPADLRGFEIVPGTLNLSEIEKKDNQSESMEKMSLKSSEEDSELRAEWPS